MFMNIKYYPVGNVKSKYKNKNTGFAGVFVTHSASNHYPLILIGPGIKHVAKRILW
jgi:hypothetical protein